MEEEQEMDEALRYHRATCHSWASIRESGHRLDWRNKPLLYKIYPGLPPLPLPREMELPGMDTLQAISSSVPPGNPGPLDAAGLAALLFLSGGITRKIRHGGQEHLFRAASSAGALYPVELYAVAGGVAGLEPGVYHFNPADFALRRLRAGDFRGALARAAGGAPGIARAPATLLLSAIFWRSAWKYQARSYRYCFWDAGTLGANLAAAATALGLPVRFHLGFADGEVNRLIGVDGRREAVLALAPVGEAGTPGGPPPELADLRLETIPLSERERTYPELERLHAASALEPPEVSGWVAAALPGPPVARPVPPPRPSASLAETIRRRGSTRRFAREPLPAGHLETVLAAATRGVPADFLSAASRREVAGSAEGAPGPGATLLDLFVNVHAAGGVEPGAYRYDRDRGLAPLRLGDFRDRSGYLCLEQPLGADAGAVVFMMADLEALLRRFGNRGYRAVQFEAGVVGGRLYLGAYSLGFGATGLTFYDEDVTEFFRPEAEGKSCIFVVALGIPAYGKGRDRLRLVHQD